MDRNEAPRHPYFFLKEFSLEQVKVKESRYRPGVAQSVPGS